LQVDKRLNITIVIILSEFEIKT